LVVLEDGVGPGRRHTFSIGAIDTGLGARMLDRHLEMILQVFADGREVMHDVDTERA
jgi:hypothetical protein